MAHGSQLSPSLRRVASFLGGVTGAQKYQPWLPTLLVCAFPGSDGRSAAAVPAFSRVLPLFFLLAPSLLALCSASVVGRQEPETRVT